MAPKAKARAKRKSIHRCSSELPRGSSAVLLARNAARQTALMARPGHFRACLVCCNAVRIADDAKATSPIRCDLRAASALTSGEKLVCGFGTKPHNWKQRSEVPAVRSAARRKAARDVLEQFIVQLNAGERSSAGLWDALRTEVMSRVPLHDAMGEGYVETDAE